jgi:hypothetical protein
LTKGKVKKLFFLSYDVLTASYPGFDFGGDVFVQSFKVIVIRDSSAIFVKENIGNHFSKDFIDFSKLLQTSDLIIFSQIKIKRGDGKEKVLGPMEFTIE